METLIALLVLLMGSSPTDYIQRLGHEDYWVRERAEKTLRMWGILALPALQEATKSDSPEVRIRVSRLIKQPQYTADLFNAAKILMSPEMPERDWFHNSRLKYRVLELAKANGWRGAEMFIGCGCGPVCIPPKAIVALKNGCFQQYYLDECDPEESFDWLIEVKKWFGTFHYPLAPTPRTK
jgi:hypothetical protein